MLVDSHCHLDKLNYDDLHIDVSDVVTKAKLAGVEQLLSVGVTLEAFPNMLEMIASFDQVHASCGVHPLDCDSDFDLTLFKQYASHRKVVAVGETGLDFFYQPETANRQIELFEQHVEVANELNKPLIIHTRNARQETLDVLKNGHAEKCGGVIHCFTEDLEFAKSAMELGFYISLSGIITFKQATELQDVVKQLPLDRLLVETDSPYLAPVPHRGKENQPAYVLEVAQFLASLKNCELEDVISATGQNFHNLFINRV
ncbi:TatD family hydrolase [Vibrio rumoiensis]|uniref:Metal-dependent hydrolase n=1 Tax=Vibrio rumoiensis 1S-45 TaxID=1188252 RepID=A0A1E5E3K1_9VIBR|nr:YchF/TatD family DNA exonuclease [Vibrio rumoiensis]OEF26925.1 metal-dependent hydrolase [Vibrio rumoiensis 1S-45]